MKRKVIQIAGSTQLISLPRKWAVKHNIRKGDELEIQEQGESLFVGITGSHQPFKKLEIDISGLGRVAKRIIGALYRADFGEIRVRYGNSEEFKYVQDVLHNSCIGFEIVEHDKNAVVIRKVSDALYEEFDSMFRRLFMSVITVAKETEEALASGTRTAFDHIVAMDNNINRLSDFCGRVLNHSTKSENVGLYFIVLQLEQVGDSYRDFAELVLRSNNLPGASVLGIYKDNTRLLQMISELFYKFDLKRLRELYELEAKISRSISLRMKTAGKQEAHMLFYASRIREILLHLDMPIIELAMSSQEAVEKSFSANHQA